MSCCGVVGAIGSWLLFDFHLSMLFTVGVGLVIAAVFLYGSSARSPQELCETLGGIVGCARVGASEAPAKSDTTDQALITAASASEADDDEEQQAHTPPKR